MSNSRLRRLLAAGLALLCALLLGGCGRGADASAELSCAALSARLQEEAGGQIVWTPLTGDQLSNYYGFSGEILRDFSVVVSDSDSLSDEIAVFDPKSPDDRLALLDGVNRHLTETAAGFRALNETEYKKLQNRLILELDGRIVLVVSDNVAQLYTVLKNLGAQEVNVSSF